MIWLVGKLCGSSSGPLLVETAARYTSQGIHGGAFATKRVVATITTSNPTQHLHNFNVAHTYTGLHYLIVRVSGANPTYSLTEAGPPTGMRASIGLWCVAETFPPIHSYHWRTSFPRETAPRAKPSVGLIPGRSAQCHGLNPWIAGSVTAHSQYAWSLPGSQAGLCSQCVPLAHHGGPPNVPALALVPLGAAQHLLSAGVVPLHSPPLSLQEPINLIQPD